jgi:hypothetical protein
MDQNLRIALARWPDVPAAYGWLSLNPRGAWRFHAEGNAYAGGPGESIGNAQIQTFISRNYTHDNGGKWFFQNGPQRVYVRIDAAPWIVRWAAGPQLVTHTGAPFGPVTQWVLDSAGRLYAQSAEGPGMIDDRDLATICDSMVTDDGMPALDALVGLSAGQTLWVRQTFAATRVSLAYVSTTLVPARLGFNRQPDTPAQHINSALPPH